MFLVWGFKARNKKVGEGSFFCPREGGDRPYVHKAAKKWFTLYFIPLIPLKELGDYVECSSCGSTFYPNILSAPTSQQIEDVTTTAIRHVAVNMLKADGIVHDSEKAAAVAVASRFVSRPYGPQDLESDLQTLNPSQLRDNLEELGAALNEHGKEQVLIAALQLAASDGEIHQDEIELIKQIGEHMTMSKAHIEGTIAVAMRDGLPQPQMQQPRQVQQPQQAPPLPPVPQPQQAIPPMPAPQQLPSEFGSQPPHPQ